MKKNQLNLFKPKIEKQFLLLPVMLLMSESIASGLLSDPWTLAVFFCKRNKENFFKNSIRTTKCVSTSTIWLVRHVWQTQEYWRKMNRLRIFFVLLPHKMHFIQTFTKTNAKHWQHHHRMQKYTYKNHQACKQFHFKHINAKPHPLSSRRMGRKMFIFTIQRNVNMVTKQKTDAKSSYTWSQPVIYTNMTREQTLFKKRAKKNDKIVELLAVVEIDLV